MKVYTNQIYLCVNLMIEPCEWIVNDLGKICGIHNLACIIGDFLLTPLEI